MLCIFTHVVNRIVCKWWKSSVFCWIKVYDNEMQQAPSVEKLANIHSIERSRMLMRGTEYNTGHGWVRVPTRGSTGAGRRLRRASRRLRRVGRQQRRAGRAGGAGLVLVRRRAGRACLPARLPGLSGVVLRRRRRVQCGAGDPHHAAAHHQSAQNQGSLFKWNPSLSKRIDFGKKPFRVSINQPLLPKAFAVMTA